MLIDVLIEKCMQTCQVSCAGNCGNRCTNSQDCADSCNGCLDQVHWYSSRGGRSDYNCPYLLCNYVLHFSERYSNQILYALKNIDLGNYPQYDIFSIGCGAAPDLMAFEAITQCDGKKHLL